MTVAAILLVLLSSFAHATWNLLAKRATTPEVFTWWMAAAGAVVFAPAAAYLLITDPPPPTGWVFVGATVALHTGYFFSLGRAYQLSDLSVVYPVARGLGVSLIPVLGVMVLGESMSLQAALGAGLIVVGVLSVGASGERLPRSIRAGRNLVRDPGVRYAIVTGLMIGGYSIIDKQGVQHVTPVLYMYLLSAGGGMGMLILIRNRYPRSTYVQEFKAHHKAIVLGGALQFTAYALTLTALTLSPVSYVGPFREVGILIGVGFGTYILKERLSPLRAAGAVSIAGGALAIALAP